MRLEVCENCKFVQYIENNEVSCELHCAFYMYLDNGSKHSCIDFKEFTNTQGDVNGNF